MLDSFISCQTSNPSGVRCVLNLLNNCSMEGHKSLGIPNSNTEPKLTVHNLMCKSESVQGALLKWNNKHASAYPNDVGL